MPVGFTSGAIPLLAMNLPLLKNYAIVGAFTGAWGDRFPDERARAADAVMAWVGRASCTRALTACFRSSRPPMR